jgi:next-to-BRCA1 protein 1
MQEDEHDLVDEVESLTLDEDETEDGFMTDEEYDILDASDQEYAVEAQKSQK